MAIRQEIKNYSIGGLEASYRLDTGMEPGGENYVVIELESGEEIIRTFYFEENPRPHCNNFVQKVARDEKYRKKCLREETTWAKIGNTYFEQSPKVYSAFTPLTKENWGSQYQKAKGQAHQWCKELHRRLSDLFESVGDPAQETIETVVENAKSEALAAAKALRERSTEETETLSINDRMPFGKHQGKSFLQIAKDDPGYAEWGAKNLSDRPEVQSAFEKSLQKLHAGEKRSV